MQKAVRSIQGNLLVIIFIILALTAFTVIAEDIKATPSKEYQSVTVEKGDTLWAIADKYQTTDMRSKNDFISWVEKVNHVNRNDIIAGQEIIIPVRQP
jgi:LysM repeat protein